ncbi:MAG: XRE family transcriptional regulator [Clostridia bacterium]|nr:XRE family transcriptional regulator [Clostridia bacterium]
MYYDTKESGKRIQTLRKERNLTQEKLAAHLNIGVSTLGKIETGYSRISIDLLIEITMYFSVSLDYVLLGRETQTDNIKKQIRTMMAHLSELERML